MSNAMKVRIVAEAKSKFGVLVEGKWRNFSNLALLAAIKVGKAYDVEEGRDAKGRSVITKVTEVILDAAPIVSQPVQEKTNAKEKATDVAPKAAVAVEKAKSSANGLSFAEKDSRILVQGLTQAVVQSNLIMKVEDVEPVVVQLMAMVLRLSGTK